MTKRTLNKGVYPRLVTPSDFVAGLCVKNFKKDLNDRACNQSCIKIANDPKLLSQLNPAARILLIVKLRQISVQEKTRLDIPNFMQTEIENESLYKEFFNFPLDYNKTKTESVLWHYVLASNPFSCCYVVRFHELLAWALEQYNWSLRQPISKEYSKMLALILVLDPRFRGDAYSGAKLSNEHRADMIEQHNLKGLISSYQTLSSLLDQVVSDGQKIKEELNVKVPFSVSTSIAPSIPAIPSITPSIPAIPSIAPSIPAIPSIAPSIPASAASSENALPPPAPLLWGNGSSSDEMFFYPKCKKFGFFSMHNTNFFYGK